MNNSIVLCTLCLNESEWLPRLYEQHKDWPGLKKWIFIESADIEYARSNPEMVSNLGLSVDGTTSFLRNLAQQDSRVIYDDYGFCYNSKAKDQGKCEARTQYLRIADDYAPDLLVVLDADEFYTKQDQETISNILDHTLNKRQPRLSYKGSAFQFNQRHIWYPPSLQTDPLKHKEYYPFSHEVVGGYWEVVHTRVWKWEPGLQYVQNHNWPEDRRGVLLIHKGEAQMRNDRRVHYSLMKMVERGIPVPQCIHMGYASNMTNRRAKHSYYVNRGEGKENNSTLRRRRSVYVDCRNDWDVWEPGISLRHEARVIPYTGPIPEVFQRELVDHARG